MKKIILFISLAFLTTQLAANPNFVISLKPHYDKYGKLVTPDRILLAKGMKAYQDGYNQSAMTKFKQSAAFGNSKAQELIGLMHIKALGVPRDWARGYAWLKLSAMDETNEHKQLRDAIFAKLSAEEKQQSSQIYHELLKDYDASQVLKRRSRWVAKQMHTATGSRTGSQTVNVQTQALNGVKKDGNRGSSMQAIEDFVNHYNFGIVTQGEIQAKN